MRAQFCVVTIDGPAGAGKSVVADGLARRLGVPPLHTGFIYRAVGKLALIESINPDDAMGCVALIRRHVITLLPSGHVAMDGIDWTRQLDTPEVADAASRVSHARVIREELRGLQRDFARAHHGVVAEGRDTGSSVFPNASLKVWLDAEPRVRQGRILKSRGPKSAAIVMARDRREEDREDDPVRAQTGAVRVDSTSLTVAEVVDAIYRLVPRPYLADSE
jgi:CMP/dCMP kinase